MSFPPLPTRFDFDRRVDQTVSYDLNWLLDAFNSGGAQGPQGAQGAQGAAGAQGSQGAQGVTGAQGLQGIAGAQGAQGFQGATGAQGAQGTAGTQGSQGTQGTQGIQGAQGSQGSAGAQGSQGAQGAQGSQGTQGTQGSQGAQGAQGASGASGVGDFVRLSQQVASGSPATLHFATISGAYSQLKLVLWGRQTSGDASGVFCKINSDTTAGNYVSNIFMQSTGSGTDTPGTDGAVIGILPGSGTNANAIGCIEALFPMYSNTAFRKPVIAHSYQVYSSALLRYEGFDWISTAAITDIVLTAIAGAFTDGTTATLYGMT